MANSADPDQKPTDLDLHCLQRKGIAEQGLMFRTKNSCIYVCIIEPEVGRQKLFGLESMINLVMLNKLRCCAHF